MYALLKRHRNHTFYHTAVFVFLSKSVIAQGSDPYFCDVLPSKTLSADKAGFRGLDPMAALATKLYSWPTFIVEHSNTDVA